MKRRVLMVPFSAVAIVLVLTSTAWACTKFLGSLSVTGNSVGSATVVSYGTDDPLSGANGTQYLTSTPASGHATACGVLSGCGLPGTFTISTGSSGPVPATFGWPGNPLGLFAPHAAVAATNLPVGTYNVTFQPGPVYVSHIDGTAGDGSDYQYGFITNAGIPHCYSFGIGSYVDPTNTTGGNGGGILVGTVNIGAAGTITGAGPTGTFVGGTATFRLPPSPANSVHNGVPPQTAGPLPPFGWGVNHTNAEESAVCVSTNQGGGGANMVPLTVL